MENISLTEIAKKALKEDVDPSIQAQPNSAGNLLTVNDKIVNVTNYTTNVLKLQAKDVNGVIFIDIR